MVINKSLIFPILLSITPFKEEVNTNGKDLDLDLCKGKGKGRDYGWLLVSEE